MQFSRRQFLTLGLTGSAALGLPVLRAAAAERWTADPASLVSVWDVNAVQLDHSYGISGVSPGRHVGYPVDFDSVDSQRRERLTSESAGHSLRVIAAGQKAHQVLTELRSGQAAADLRFADITNVPLRPMCDIAIFVGDAGELSRLNPVAADTAFWPIAIVLGANSAADLVARKVPVFNYRHLLFAGAAMDERQLAAAADMLDMVAALALRHGMIGTDLSDIRRVLTSTGECHFECRRGTSLETLYSTIDTVLADATLDARTTGVLAMIAGPHELAINDFMYLNDRLVPAAGQAEVLVTLKTLEGWPQDRFAVALWTISDDRFPEIC